MAAGSLLWVVLPTEGCCSCSSGFPQGSKLLRIKRRRAIRRSFSSISASLVATPWRSSEERVYDVILKQAALVKNQEKSWKREMDMTAGTVDWSLLNEAYERCGEVCAEYAKTFYLG